MAPEPSKSQNSIAPVASVTVVGDKFSNSTNSLASSVTDSAPDSGASSSVGNATLINLTVNGPGPAIQANAPVRALFFPS